MSWKNANRSISQAPGATARRAWSLAARLTVWNAASGFALVLAASGYLYWSSVSNIDREDDQLLGDRVRVLRAVMLNRPGDADAIRQEVNEEWDARQRTQVHMRIMNGAGQVMVETPGMSPMLPASSFPVAATEPDTGADIDSATGGLFRVLAVSVKASGVASAPRGDDSANDSTSVIHVAMDRSLALELRARYRKNLIFVLSASLLICAVVGYGVAHRSIRPIHDITRTARRIRPSNLSERITSEGLPAELLTLAATFNEMLDRLEQSFARLSRFSADIAHEFRTPVYSLRGEIEVALGKPRSLEEYREVLNSGLEECSRLARLIDRLLFLARAENPQTQIAWERCDVSRELATVSAFYDLAASEAGVELVVHTANPVAADLDRSLFQRAVGNLVANALAHTPRGGSVRLSAAADDQSTRVEVEDTGCGIPPTHLPHVLDRFYRVDHSRSSKNGSVGLGLAIVRSIVELHGGTVEIASELGRGTRVSLILPTKASRDHEENLISAS
jgi:two-component system heavy metal sensor histidine kinase CusS